MNKELEEFIKKGHEIYMSHLSIDCLIFGFHGNQLKILLLKMKHLDHWALPGGFILVEENIDASADRILKERTGLDDIFLQQFYVFGDPARSNAEGAIAILKKEGIQVDRKNWFTKRFISIGYYAL